MIEKLRGQSCGMQRVMLLGLFFCVTLFFFIGTKQAWWSSFRVDNSNERRQIDTSLYRYQNVDPTQSSEANDSYKNLVKQQSLLARLENAYVFEQPEKYHQLRIELNDTRLSLIETEDYDLLKEQQPAIGTLIKERIRLRHIRDDVIISPLDMTDWLLKLLRFIGMLWVPICVFLTSRILEDELSHPSVNKGVPKRFHQKVLTKWQEIGYSLVMSVLLVGGTVCVLSALFGQGIGGLGRIDVLFMATPQAIPSYFTVLIYLVYFFLLYTFVFLCSVVLNGLTRQFYMTLFIELFVYSLVWLIPKENFPKSLSFLQVFHPTSVLEGRFIMASRGGEWNGITGMLLLIVGIGVLIVLIQMLQLEDKVWKGGRG